MLMNPHNQIMDAMSGKMAPPGASPKS